ncbi:MAG: TetR/AcrR family transcriptional regulator [Acidimicrobiales bacterium]
MSNAADRDLGRDKHMVPMTDRKAEIVGVAGRLMAERGIDGASLRHIGDAVGMRRGSLYAHFDAKEEIVELVLGPALAALRDVLSEPPEPGQSALNHLRARFQAAVECTIEYRDAFLILFQDRRLIDESVLLRPLSDQANAITPLWIKLIEAGQAEGSLRSDLHPTTIALGLYALLVAAFSNRHLGLEVAGGQLDSDAIVGHVVTLFFDGVLT